MTRTLATKSAVVHAKQATAIGERAFEHRQLKQPTEVKGQELSKAVSPSVQKHREQHLFSRQNTYSQTKNDQSCSWEPWREIRKYQKSTDLHPKSKDGPCNVSRWSVHQLDRHKYERRLYRRRVQSERDGTRRRTPGPCGWMLLPLMNKRRKQDPLRSDMEVARPSQRPRCSSWTFADHKSKSVLF